MTSSSTTMRGFVSDTNAAKRLLAVARSAAGRLYVCIIPTACRLYASFVVKIHISPATYRRITFWTIVALGAIVLTGVSVRLTGSGLGCPDWPSCDDQFFPTEENQYHAWIEFGNRLVTGVVSVAVVLAVLGSLWRVPKRNDLVWWSLGLVAGVGAQVILGRWVVTSELKPWVVIAHFLLSMVLLWNAIVLHHRADERNRRDRSPTAGNGLGFRNGPPASSDGSPSLRTSPQADLSSTTLRLGDSRLRAMLWVMSVLAGWVLVNGTLVTGSGPHGGDENAERLSFDIADVARLHSISVIVFCVLVLGIFWMLFRSSLRLPEEALKPMYVLMAVIAMQGFIGYLQYFNDVPELLVGLHVLGAISVWWATLHAHLTVWNAHLEQRSLPLSGSERHSEQPRELQHR